MRGTAGRILKHLEDGLSAALLLFGLVIVVMEIASRATGSGSFLWSEEVSRYTLIWMTYLGVAAAVRANANIRVTVLIGMLPVRAQRALELAICLLCLVFALFVAWYGLAFVEGARMLGLMSSDSDLPIPIWVFQAIVPVGFALIALRLVERMVRIVRDPTMDVLEEEP